MPQFKTNQFLPEVFRTQPNRKFLSATLDQLVAEPEYEKVNGYVGRLFAPSYKKTDNYVQEITAQRQNYQLEPCVIIEDSKKNVTQYSSYVDLLDKINFYGGDTTNHDRLFSGELYSFNGIVDLDKLINFSQYWWVPNGPDLVDIIVSPDKTVDEFLITKGTTYFSVDNNANSRNPDIVVLRGGKYKFKIDQPGSPVWIQTNANVNGNVYGSPNVSSRDVYGVENNGVDTGEIIFSVPAKDDQTFFASMQTDPTYPVVDYATEVPYNQLHNHKLSDFLSKYQGLDGVTANIDNKTVIFVSTEEDDYRWDPTLSHAYGGNFESVPGYSGIGQMPGIANRGGLYRINLIQIPGDPSGDKVIQLTFLGSTGQNKKVFVLNGQQHSGVEYFKNVTLVYQRVELVTATLTELYYVDSTSNKHAGKIIIKDPVTDSINIEEEILGKISYVSPNGIMFTNGMRVRFDDRVTPASYANNIFYVEGVGKEIRLVAESDLFTPESVEVNKEISYDFYPWDSEKYGALNESLNIPSYVTINRSSRDLNSWSRRNRWVHQDVLEKIALYNGTQVDFSLTSSAFGFRAVRPIVEFLPDLALYNYCRRGRGKVDIVDVTTTDAFNDIEGSTVLSINNVPVTTGTTVLFSKDKDPLVRTRVYTVKIIEVNAVPTIALFPTYTLIEEHDGIVAILGDNKGENYYYLNGVWVVGQKQHKTNMYPLFDIVDVDNVSISDKDKYPGSTFKGSKLFGYSESTNVATYDKNLGFSIKYKNFTTIGDIEFTNFHQTASFSYIIDSVTADRGTFNVKSFFPVKSNRDNTLTKTSFWTKSDSLSKQRQIFTYFFQGSYKFQIDILPETLDKTNISVYVNSKKIDKDLVTFFVDSTNNYFSLAYGFKENDKIDVVVYSKQSSNLGFYQVPANLELNAENKVIETITLGQLRNHVATVANNTLDLKGEVPGSSNLRDINVSGTSGNILLHRSPAIYGQLFLLHNQVNFVDSIVYAQKEYAKFKNKFLDIAKNLRYELIRDPIEGVDLVLKEMNIVKNKTFPWHYSDMVPYGDNKTVTTYTVLNNELRNFAISETFNPNELSNRAVIVYVNNQQMVKDIDFEFRQDVAAIRFKYDLTLDSEVRIVEYLSTDGSYVPETPTKLGLYPKFVPTIKTDKTYSSPVNVIVGHDGSITPVFGDYRDDLLLELERRIFNNIKITSGLTLADIQKLIPGKFRNTEYTRGEFNNILATQFLRWIGNNRLDYSTNINFENNDYWSWNYSTNVDRLTREQLPGHWRGIYRYFYDTDNPSEEPWVMLGFSMKPDWWEDSYGPAPYTGGNLPMWRDIEKGIVRGTNSEREAGTYEELARPGLTNVIPIDASGNANNPAEFIMYGFNGGSFGNNYVFGDVAPVESAWRRSSDYPFALQIALALAKPAYYFGSLADITSFKYNNELDQTINSIGEFVKPSNLGLNSEIVNGIVSRKAGYLNWIVDYLTNNGINGTAKIRELLDNLSVRLGYNVGGYTDQNRLQVFADQNSPGSVSESVVLPDENFKVFLHKSAPNGRAIYSAVIVEVVNGGFSVRGYNTSSPFFTIFPSEINSNNYQLQVFDATATIYGSYRLDPVLVPYGTQFSTKKQVVDFLVSYERYLKFIGFEFNDWNEELTVINDWLLSCKEFMTWAQQGWTEGTLLVLSPTGSHLKFNNGSYSVDEITNKPTESKLLDQNFSLIRQSDFSVLREENTFEVNANGRMIAYAELFLVQYEHCIVFDNETMFKDVIYKPELGNRQHRLKLVGSKTSNWTGKFNPAGFVYNSPIVPSWQAGRDYLRNDLVEFKNNYYVAITKISAADTFDYQLWRTISVDQIKSGLLQNFAFNAKKFIDFYDVDSITLDEEANIFAKGLIGFRPRSYLLDIGIDDVTQIKFYQGMIKEKGTVRSINALNAAQFEAADNTLDINEEWAVRVGEYGGIEHNQFFEVDMSKNTVNTSPSIISLIEDTEENADPNVNAIKLYNLYKRPQSFKRDFALLRDDSSTTNIDIKTAGYVNINDVDATIFDINDYRELNDRLPYLSLGFKIWVANDDSHDWNVYRVTESESQFITVAAYTDNAVKITFAKPHDLKIGDIFAMYGNDYLVRVSSFYRVSSTSNPREVVAEFGDTFSSVFESVGSFSGVGVLCKLQSVRYKFLSDVVDNSLIHNWKTIDYAWVDHAQKPYVSDTKTSWGVYKKNEPVDLVQEMYLSTNVRKNDFYGAAVAIDKTGQKMIAVSAPNKNSMSGEISYYKIYKEGVPILIDTIRSRTNDVKGLGASLDMTENVLVAGAPRSNGFAGAVVVYRKDGDHFSKAQTIYPPFLVQEGRFGHSVAISKTERWLYIGQPKANSVYVYALIENEYRFVSIINNTDVSLFGEFGHSISTNDTGSVLLVGAPWTAEDINGTEYTRIGAAYVYNRYDQKFTNPGGALESDSNNVVFVLKNNEELKSDRATTAGNTAIIYTTLTSNDIVTLETADFVLTTKLLPEVPVECAEFGFATEVSENGEHLFVSAPSWNKPDYHNGAVFVYTAQTEAYYTITTINPFASISVGGSMVIDGYRVANTGKTAESFVTDINNAKIPNISATFTEDGFITLKGKKPFAIYKGTTGSLFDQLGFVQHYYTQTLTHPERTFDSNQQFGISMSYDNVSKMLFVGSKLAEMVSAMAFDSKTTTFDNNLTGFYSKARYSGAVYTYQLLDNNQHSIVYPNKFGFVQQLKDPCAEEFDEFGSSVAANNYVAIVGAPFADVATVNCGKAMLYRNDSQLPGWQLTRYETPKVDFNCINRVYLYNKETHLLQTDLDFVDPAKGKIIGIAQEEIDVASILDPAWYNRGVSASEARRWGKDHVGLVWWDLSKVKLLDYEQGSLTYRANNWGYYFPGSKINVYEWVESPVKPSEYIAKGLPGTPKDPDDSKYCVSYAINEATGEVKNTFYFWVYDKESVGKNHNISVKNIANIINSPYQAGIPCAAIIASNTIALYGVDNYTATNNAVLHVEYSNFVNRDPIPVHTEYELIQESSSSQKFPQRLIRKTIDSLVGEDLSGKFVPDQSLPETQRYGLSIRPRQSMFVNRFEAGIYAIQFINDIFKKFPVAINKDISRLYEFDPYPAENEYDVVVPTRTDYDYIASTLKVGTKVLIKSDSNYDGRWTLNSKVYDNSDLIGFDPTSPAVTYTLKILKMQTFNVADHWTFEDWYAEGFDSSQEFTYVVEDEKELAKYSVATGDIVFVRKAIGDRFAIYKMGDNLTREYLGVQKGTIAINKGLPVAGYKGNGYSSMQYAKDQFDSSLATPYRIILETVKDYILIGEHKSFFNDVIFGLLKYVLHEQGNNVDWLFKTSFVSIVQKIRKLDQYPTYIKENQDYYRSYIEEVKPYRTKIREYTLNYTGSDTTDISMTDFDLPPYYDKEVGIYRAPSQELDKDPTMLSSFPEYKAWNDNHSMFLDKIVVTNKGSGYTQPPTITIVGNGTGATAVARINYSTLEVEEVLVTNPGSGYTITPTILINGVGTGLALTPIMSNNKTRKLNVTLKRDCVDYKDPAYFDSEKFDMTKFGDIIPVCEDDTLLVNVFGAGFKEEVVYKDDTQEIRDFMYDTFIKSEFTDNLEDVGSVIIDGGKFVHLPHVRPPAELLPGITYDTLNLKVFIRHNTSTYGTRFFKNKNNNWKFTRISALRTTELSTDLLINDTEINVVNGEYLFAPIDYTVPGVVFINGERIEYLQKIGNTLKYIRRNTAGTGALLTHAAGSKVVDSSVSQDVPGIMLKEKIATVAFDHPQNEPAGTTYTIKSPGKDDIEALVSPVFVKDIKYSSVFFVIATNGSYTTMSDPSPMLWPTDLGTPVITDARYEEFKDEYGAQIRRILVNIKPAAGDKNGGLIYTVYSSTGSTSSVISRKVGPAVVVDPVVFTYPEAGTSDYVVFVADGKYKSVSEVYRSVIVPGKSDNVIATRLQQQNPELWATLSDEQKLFYIKSEWDYISGHQPYIPVVNVTFDYEHTAIDMIRFEMPNDTGEAATFIREEPSYAV